MTKEEARKKADQLLHEQGTRTRQYSRIEVEAVDPNKPDGACRVVGRPFGDHLRRDELAR